MIDVVDMFINYGGDPTIKNKVGFTSLHIAARDGRTEIVKLLLNKGELFIILIEFQVVIQISEMPMVSVLLTGQSKTSITIFVNYYQPH